MSSFEFHDHNDNEVIVSPVAAPEGPAVWLYARQGHTSTNVIIPLDRVEEVVAGLRDMARQAGGQAEPLPIPSAVRSAVLREAAAVLEGACPDNDGAERVMALCQCAAADILRQMAGPEELVAQ